MCSRPGTTSVKLGSARWAALIASVVLSSLACGGGGGGGSGELPVQLGRDGTGDAQAYLPLATGNRWYFLTHDSIATNPYVELVRVAGTRTVRGAAAMVVQDMSADGLWTVSEKLLAPDANGIARMPADDVGDLEPYWMLRYPVHPGTSFVQLDRKAVPLGVDLDGDGEQDRFDVESTVNVAAVESVTVPVGTFPGCVRVEWRKTSDLIFSRDGQRLHQSAVETAWFAPGVGWVKRSWEATADGVSPRTRTEELIGYSVGTESRHLALRATPPAITLPPGAAQPVRVIGVSPDGAEVQVPVTWASSDPSVADLQAMLPVTLNDTVAVIGVAVGTANVTASIGEMVSNPVAVTVSAPVAGQPSLVWVDPTTVTLATGSSTTITASVYDAWGARLETAASWRSSDPTVATVDSTGKITGVRAGTASVVASAGSASSIVTVSVTSLTTVALRSNDLVADASRGRVYASVPSSVGVHGNTIAVIDPVSRTVLAYHFVGSEPSKLALSDDARFLYVALEGAGKVARVDLSNPSSPTVDLTFSLGSVDYYGQRYVEDMAVMPGAPGTVAISLRYKNLSPRHAGVAIYDDGVQRPTMTPGHTGSNVIEFSASGSLLYGLNNETTEFGFRRMQVTASGVTVLTVSAFAAGFGTDIAFGGGLIYGSTGVVYDPEARSIEGTFTGMTSGSIVEASPVGERVLFLASAGASSGPWSLRAFDRGTFVPVGSTPLPGVTSTPASLVRWGSRGIAFRLATTWGVPGEAVYFVETDLAAP